MISVITQSVEATQALAKKIGAVVRGGEHIELISDVGGGKTTFAKGLAQGMQVEEVVQSPTFTISRIYHARQGLELHHFDFYRLNQAGVVAAELAESLLQPNAVVVVEWGQVVHQVLAKKHLTVKITSLEDSVRQFDFSLPEAYDHILQAVTQFKAQQGLA